METIKNHVGIFDFWSVFGAGTVILTSYVMLLKPETLDNCTDAVCVAFYVALAYSIGLILYCISSICVDLEVFKLSASKAVRKMCKKKASNSQTNTEQESDNSNEQHFSKFEKRYLIKYPSETLFCFNAQYDILKLHGSPPRVDKLHSIYGMARGVSAGYFILAVLALIVYSKYIISLIFAILAIMFYFLAKKYLYRWIEWIFQEFEYLKETAPVEERVALQRVYQASSDRYKNGNGNKEMQK